MSKMTLNRYLDHAVLKPHWTPAEAADEMRLGIEHTVRTICVRPCDLKQAVDLCAGTETDPCVVLGFPHGVGLPRAKATEAELYIDLGAREIDMVTNYGYIRAGLWANVVTDIQAVSQVTQAAGVPLKVIFETCELSLDQIRGATEAAVAANADWVKTSTGFSSGGATEAAVLAMIEAADGRIQVKASGGIRDAETAWKYVDMGCTRLGVGSSTTPALMAGGGLDGDGY